MTDTFHVLTVSNPDQPRSNPLKLTFTDRLLALETDFELAKRGYDVKRAMGNQLYAGPAGKVLAINHVGVFLGVRE